MEKSNAVQSTHWFPAECDNFKAWHSMPEGFRETVAAKFAHGVSIDRMRRDEARYGVRLAKDAVFEREERRRLATDAVFEREERRPRLAKAKARARRVKPVTAKLRDFADRGDQ